MDTNKYWIPSYVNSLLVNSSGHIFAGTEVDGLFRSTDNGVSWSQINSGLTDGTIFSLALNSSGKIFAGTNQSGIFTSTNNGNNWSSSGLANENVYAIVINSSGYIFAGTGGDGIFRSTDNGNNWSGVNSGLTNTNVYSLAVNSGGYIFAGTGGDGIFHSINSGSSWSDINSGLTDFNIFSLVFNSSGYIFAGTSEKAVFRSIQPVTSIEENFVESRTTFSLYQNYPNPFSPITVFNFHLPISSEVTLKVYNILGNEIATLVNERKEAGNYSVEWNAEKFSSGMYFYRLSVSEKTETRKMMLMK
mgnify:FL=1